MHIDRHSHHAKTAYLLLLIVIGFLGYLLYTYPDLRRSYVQTFTPFLAEFTQAKNNTPDQSTYPITDIATSASITEFGSTTNTVLIDNSTLQDPSFIIDATASSTSDNNNEPSQVGGFKPSPESQWASAYLTILNTNFEILDLQIQYVRSWQQVGGFLRDLKPGSKGQDVLLMQYLLHKFEPNFNMSGVTGTFGPKTTSALINLQKKLGIKPTGIFNEETRFFFDSVYFKELCPDADPKQDKTYENVSRRVSVPLDYIPSDLIRLPKAVRTVGVMCLSREPSKRLEEMFAAAAKEGHELAIFSAYRSAKTQKLLTQYYLSTLGKAGLAGVAEEGHSEHQLGTAIDISGKSIKYAGPSQKFASSPEGIWLAANSYKYGFILSYPAGRQKDTGYIFEPWHFRYVGVDTARDIFEEKLTIQEYFDLVRGNGYSFDQEQ